MLHIGPLPSGAAQTNFIADMRAHHAIGVERVMVMPGAQSPAAEVAGLAPVVQALAAF